MKCKRILSLIVIVLIVILFVSMLIIKSKMLVFSKIVDDNEIVNEINNTNDEEIENTEVMAFKNNIEEQAKVEEIPQEIDTVKGNIQEETKEISVATQDKKIESSRSVEQTKTTPVTTTKEKVEKEKPTVSETKAPEQPKEKPKIDIKQSEKAKCSDTKHGVGVGNSNKWFSSKQDAINYYQGIIKTWGDKWEKFEINDETYQKNCPYGYETWSCPFCGKWTINFYYN